ncbi:hypothetical protein Tco_0532317 [Tanacetum coccineum]
MFDLKITNNVEAEQYEESYLDVEGINGNEPILALPEGADDFVVYYDARSKDLEACLEKGRSITILLKRKDVVVELKDINRDHVLKWDIELHFIPTQYQLADIFTKPLDEPTFKRLIVELGMLNIDSKLEASVLLEEN